MLPNHSSAVLLVTLWLLFIMSWFLSTKEPGAMLENQLLKPILSGETYLKF
jgi:hypothetical protein